MANLNNFMFKVKDYNKNKSNNIVNSNITFNEYADKWLKEYRLQIRKLDLPIVINNINIGKYYFGQKRLKDITSLDYQQFLMNYSLGRKKSSVEQANSIIQSLLKSALNKKKYIIIKFLVVLIYLLIKTKFCIVQNLVYFFI